LASVITRRTLCAGDVVAAATTFRRNCAHAVGILRSAYENLIGVRRHVEEGLKEWDA